MTNFEAAGRHSIGPSSLNNHSARQQWCLLILGSELLRMKGAYRLKDRKRLAFGMKNVTNAADMIFIGPNLYFFLLFGNRGNL